MAQTIEKEMGRRRTDMCVPLRGLHPNLWSYSGAFDEETKNPIGIGLWGNRTCLPELSHDPRRKDGAGRDEASSVESHADRVLILRGAVEQHARHCEAFQKDFDNWLAKLADVNRRCDEAKVNLERFYADRSQGTD